MADENVLLSFQHISKEFPGVKALKDISFDVLRGEVHVLLGENGAGKSTLVKIMTTLIGKDSGDLLIAGINPEINPAKIQKMIGVASQDNEIDLSEQVGNLLVFQCRLFGLAKTEANRRANELIDLFRLTAERDKKAGALSGGNKRRLHCALALVHRPRILFLDEPTVGMDPVARANFWEVISTMNTEEGVTVFLTTQYLDEADKHATNMALIAEGEIHYSGTIADFKKMVNPDGALSLDESYLQYVKTLTTWQS